MFYSAMTISVILRMGSGDILELAARYRDEGADELVFYDITASPDDRSVDRSWVTRVAEIIDIPFCVAGGIRSVDEGEKRLVHDVGSRKDLQRSMVPVRRIFLCSSSTP